MKRVLQTAVFTLCLAAFSHGATAPAQNMTPYSLAAEYYGMLHGHHALYDFDSSAMGAHFMRLHYMPTCWLRFSAGFGGGHAYVDPASEGNKVDIAVTAGLGLYVPKLFDFLTLTAGYDGSYVKAAEKREIHHGRADINADGQRGTTPDTFYVGITREGSTATALHTPYFGLIFHAGRFVDFEIGGLYQYYEILKKNRTITDSDISEITGDLVITGRDFREIRGEVMDQARIYSAITLHERESGAYLSSGFSYALTNQGDNNRSHLTNFSFWAQIGLVMRDPRGSAPAHKGYDSGYADLKRRQDRMAGELARDIDRDRQRQAERRKNRGAAEDNDDDDGDIIIINLEK